MSMPNVVASVAIRRVSFTATYFRRPAIVTRGVSKLETAAQIIKKFAMLKVGVVQMIV